MAEPSHIQTEDRRRRWWTALGGLVVFTLLGLILAPGLTRHQPVAPPAPDSLEGALEGAARPPRAAAAPEPSRPLDPEVLAEESGFDCMIQPNEVIDIGSPVTGLIEEIPVERSDFVEAGAVLARLESRVEEAAARVARARAEADVEIESATAQMQLGRRRRDRALQLFESESLSLDLREGVETEATLAALELERAQVNHRLSRLQLEQAVAALERRTIRSPVSGFVVERLMAPGEVVDEETLMRVAQIDPLRVEVILPSQWFGRVERGDRAEIVPEMPYDEPREADVVIVDRVLDGATGTFGVRLRLPNPDQELPSGLRCQVRFVGDEARRAQGAGVTSQSSFETSGSSPRHASARSAASPAMR